MSFGRRKIIGCQLSVSSSDCYFTKCEDCYFEGRNQCVVERRKYGAVVHLNDGVVIKQVKGHNADFSCRLKELGK